MHSSRMRTGHSLTVCCSVLPGGRGGGVPGLVGCLAQGGFSLVPGGCLVGGILLGPEGGSAWSRGGSPWSRGGSPWSWGGFSRDPPVNRITDMCKNITLATTLLRPVKMQSRSHRMGVEHIHVQHCTRKCIAAAPCEQYHWYPHNTFHLIRKTQSRIVPCEQTLKERYGVCL